MIGYKLTVYNMDLYSKLSDITVPALSKHVEEHGKQNEMPWTENFSITKQNVEVFS